MPAKQVVPIPLGPLDTKGDPRQGAPRIVLVENCHQVKKGLWAKRDGLTSLVRNIDPSGSIASGKKLFPFMEELLQIGATSSSFETLYSYSPQTAKWLARGASSHIAVTPEPVTSTPFSQSVVDSQIIGNLMCVVYETDASIFHYVVIDLNTGERLVRDTVSPSAGLRPRLAVMSDRFCIVYNSGANLRARSILTSTPTTLGSESTIATNLNATANFDVIREASTDAVLVVYHTTTPDLTVKRFDNTLTVISTFTHAQIPDQCVSWLHHDWSDAFAHIGLVSSTGGVGVQTVTLNRSSGVFVATAVDTATVAAANITGFRQGTSTVFVEVRAAATYNCMIRRDNGVYQRSCGIAGKVFKQGSTYYLPAAYSSTLQSTYFLFPVGAAGSGAAPSVATKLFYGSGGGLTARTSCLPTVPSFSSTVFYWPALRLTQLPQSGVGLTYTGLTVWTAKLDFSSNLIGPPRRHGDVLHIPGGIMRLYDSVYAVEAGFHTFGEAPTLTPAAGGSMTVSKTYQYVIVWSWFDGRGGVHRLSSIPASVAMSAAQNRVDLTIPTCRLTEKQLYSGSGNGQFMCDIYRTVGDGEIFFKITAQVAGLMSRTDQDTVTYQDNASDASITGNEQLYTTGGELAHAPPPASRFLEVAGQRLFALDGDDPNLHWYTKYLTPGFGPGWNISRLRFSTDGEGGACTAYGEIDGRLVIFKRGFIYRVDGDGFDNKGGGANYEPLKLPAEVGSVGPHVAKIPAGLLFMSAKGFYLLDRGYNAIDVSDGAFEWKGLTITGAVVHDAISQAWFTTSEGRTLVYDWSIVDANGRGTWTTHTGMAAVSATLWQRQFVLLATDGTAKKLVAGQYNDDGSAIAYKLKTSWIQPAGFAGAGLVHETQHLVEAKATCIMTARFAYDLDETVAQSPAIALTTASKRRTGVKQNRTRMDSLQVTIEESSTTQGIEWSGMALTVAPRGALPGLPSSQRMT